MKVEISYYGQARQAAGVGSENVDLEGSPSLVDALRKIADSHGDLLRKILFASQDTLSSSLLITVNDDVITGSAIPALNDNDRISIVPPIAGG